MKTQSPDRLLLSPMPYKRIDSLKSVQSYERSGIFKNATTLSPMVYQNQNSDAKSKISSRLNDSDVETIESENESDDDGKEDSGSDDSELNHSDVCPLETFDIDFENYSNNKEILNYFQVKYQFDII